MIDLPKVSIVTPSFNQGIFLEQTIRSVLDQDYPNLEYVVMDGGSTDASAEIIRRYESRLHFWTSEKDEGHADALNKGFSHTSGDIMAWINSDDMYTPWSLKVVAQVFEQFPEVNWLLGFQSFWNRDGAMTGAERNTQNIHDCLLGRYRFIQQESVFWRRSLWDKAGGHISRDYSLMIDSELWTRFFLHEQLYSIDCILAGYRRHSANRAHQNYQRCLDETSRAIDAMRKLCPADIMDRHRRLRSLADLKALPTATPAVLLQRMTATFSQSELEQIMYKHLVYEDERWALRFLPFAV